MPGLPRGARRLCLLVAILSLPCGRAPAAPAPAPRAADAWVSLARAHEAGARDPALGELAQWDGERLRSALYGLAAVRRELPTPEWNDVLLRGALLHTDLALLAPDLAKRFQGFPEWASLPAIQALDGQSLGVTFVTAHWRFARELLDRVRPSPRDDPRVLAWYRAVGGTLVANRQLALALPLLDRALRLFPDDPDVNGLTGLVHEELSAFAARGVLGHGRAGVAGPTTELRAARTHLGRAADAEPADTEIQLHLARVCHLLGDHDAASGAVAKVLSRAADSRSRYLAELLNGSIQEATHHLDAARESFERAAALCPTAQTPLILLSELARRAGDRSAAVAYIERLAALPTPAGGMRDDPWWVYDRVAALDHAALLESLRDEMRGRHR